MTSEEDFNQILSKTLESQEFNNMLGSLSETIKNNLENIQQNETDQESQQNETNESESSINLLCENLIDILGSYLMDDHGNNICSILQDINTNIKKNNEIKQILNSNIVKLITDIKH